jgi:hypothetical protein
MKPRQATRLAEDLERQNQTWNQNVLETDQPSSDKTDPLRFDSV